jgi:hypothetical protein
MYFTELSTAITVLYVRRINTSAYKSRVDKVSLTINFPSVSVSCVVVTLRYRHISISNKNMVVMNVTAL